MNTITVFLDLLAAPTMWLLAQPQYVSMTIIGLLICAAMITCGIAIAKLRLSPLWSLAILAPYVPAVLLWILAYKQWPQKKHG